MERRLVHAPQELLSRPIGGVSLTGENELHRSLATGEHSHEARHVLEDQIGSLEEGKKADLAVLDRDLLTCAVDELKDTQVLRTFVTDRGKMIPRRISGASARQQRVISTAIRRARMLALLPFSVTGD